MFGLVANSIDDAKHFLRDALRIAAQVAKAVAFAALVATTTATLGPIDADAQTTGTGPSDAVCTGAGRLLDSYIEGNASTFSAADRVQLRALVNWIGDGCRGTLTLGRTVHSIGAATFLQATLGRQYNFDNSIRFAGPLDR